MELLKLFWIRVQIAARVLFSKKRHMVLIRVDEENLIKLLKEEEIDASISFVYLQKYNAYCLIKSVVNSVSFVDEVEMKAEWQAGVDEFVRRNTPTALTPPQST